MEAEKWKQIKEVFNQMLELDESSRPKFLSTFKDETLIREVKNLLIADESAENFLEGQSILPDDFSDNYHNKNIGNYKILHEIGSGGMGTVYLAEREDLKQKVALKIIRDYTNSELILRRFRREQEILAALEHPNIARLLDVGVSSEGIPFLVMEYVEGRDLHEYCRSKNLSLNEKLTLFRKVCAAVSYAHSRLVVHRDLKPSNILVNEKGEPKLLDFGISKLISESGTENKGTVTSFGMLTPNYASPEQFQGETVSTSTDVYSLGVILFKLLTDTLPYEFAGKRFDEVARAVCETEPQRPSAAVIRKFAFNNSTDKDPGNRDTQKQSIKIDQRKSKTDSRQLKGDLDNIILKSLRKEPLRRYLSVEQFSEDLRRHLEELPVTARPDIFSYRAAKFIKRNRTLVFSGASVFLILLVGVAGITWQYFRAERQRVLAEKRFDEVRQMANNVVFKYYDEIDKLTGSTKIRGIMVTDALSYLDGLAQDSAGDPSLRKELGLAYLRIGKVQGRVYNANLGDTTGAVQSYRKGIELLEPFVVNSEDTKFQWDFINSLGELSNILRRQGNLAEAEVLFKRAVSLNEQFLARNPEDSSLLTRSAYSYYFEGDSLPLGTGDNENITAYKRSLAAAEKVLVKDPNHARANNIYAADMQRIGNQLLILARNEEELGNQEAVDKLRAEARPYYYKAIEIAEKLMKINPDDALNQGILSAAKFNESEYLFDTGQFESALRVELVGLQESDIRVKADPENDENKLNSTYIYSALSSTYIRLNNFEKAGANYDQAMKIFDDLTAHDASNLEYSQRRLITANTYADELLRLGKIENARHIYINEFDVFEKHVREKEPQFVGSMRGLMLEKLANCDLAIAKQNNISPAKRRELYNNALANYQKTLEIWRETGVQISLGVIDNSRLAIVRQKAEFITLNL